MILVAGEQFYFLDALLALFYQPYTAFRKRLMIPHLKRQPIPWRRNNIIRLIHNRLPVLHLGQLIHLLVHEELPYKWYLNQPGQGLQYRMRLVIIANSIGGGVHKLFGEKDELLTGKVLQLGGAEAVGDVAGEEDCGEIADEEAKADQKGFQHRERFLYKCYQLRIITYYSFLSFFVFYKLSPKSYIRVNYQLFCLQLINLHKYLYHFIYHRHNSYQQLPPECTYLVNRFETHQEKKDITIMQGQKTEYRAPRTVKTFFTQVHKAYSQQDTKRLTQTLKQMYFGNQYQHISVQSWNATIKIAQQYTSFSSDPITPHFIKILQLIKTYQLQKKAKQWQNAFDLHLKVVVQCLQLIKQMKDMDGMWILKPLRVLLRSTKRIFLQSMKHILNSSKLKNDLINTLNRFKSTRSLLEQVRVQIVPLIENMQISILFNFHNYEMIKMIVYTSKLSLNPENKFRDNFLFLKAKYALVNEKFRQAEQHFEMINVRTVGQKRLVLKYLIPCKIFLGKMYEPRVNCPEQYFPEYETLIKALKNASFKSFDSVVEKYQKVWIKRGIYLLMDRLRVLIWRNLIKRVYNVLGEKIMFEKIEKAVKLAGGDQNINECICIIGNLIYEGYVKGYIFQNEQIRGLILKKDKCFPKLSEIVG